MKVFASVIVSLVVLSAVHSESDEKYSEEDRKKILKNREDCVAETKVNPELIDRADKGDFVDDDKLKCFTKCFYQKVGFVTEKGELLLDTIKAKMPDAVDKDKAIKVIENCKQEGKDPCETVYLIHKCYFEYTHKPASEKANEEENKSEADVNKKTDEKDTKKVNDETKKE